MFIYLLRHARTQVINGDFLSAGLSGESTEAASDLARSGRIPSPDLLVSSPFRRARETAAPFAEHFSLDVESDHAFAEWKLRTLNLDDEAHSTEERRGFSEPDAVVAGGESLNQMRDRVVVGLESLRLRKAETILVVTHGTVIHLLCAGITGRLPTIEALRSTAFLDYAVLESDANGLRVVRDIVRDND